MRTSLSNTVAQKKDLHVGGLGSNTSGVLATFSDPALGVTDTWLRAVKDVVRDADDFVAANPWTSVAVAAAMGAAAAYLLSLRAED